ncbi:MAG: hypothetical protein Terrestrivirus1_270 [Terrestrivirus sp.]|uniref:Uncharacterized protein n=1 Tax=Terrestrivirus sp. TaxID=2487775 RepID=A0A3G4ZKM7_9VIRU|nr:MAG: hypothetical protein Terrestrivirus1_270 [Terrestrivirus sp.]
MNTTTTLVLIAAAAALQESKDRESKSQSYGSDNNYTNEFVYNSSADYKKSDYEHEKNRLTEWLKSPIVCDKCDKLFIPESCMVRKIRDGLFKSCVWDSTTTFTASDSSSYYNLIIDDAMQIPDFFSKKKSTVTHAANGLCHKCFKKDKKECIVQ